jgi:transketolase
MQSLRDAFGDALVDISREYESIIVVDADNALATRTEKFARIFPERFLNVGIAEQNMIGVAAGLALADKIPFVSTHAIFLCGRAYEQIRTAVCYGDLNVKLVGSHGGIAVGHDGPTHFAIEDIALMTAIPGMTVIAPADGPEMNRAVKAAVQHKGPVYLRSGRSNVPAITDGCSGFEIGRGYNLCFGNDVAIIACGLMVSKALAAREELYRYGIIATVTNFHTIKPIDTGLIHFLASECRAIVVAEEHNIYGGLGSIVATVLANDFPIPVEFVAIRDSFCESGDENALFDKYGLGVQDIVLAALRVAKRKSRD